MPTDTHALRAFAVYLAGDGYTDEHVRMIECAADEIEALRAENAALHMRSRPRGEVDYREKAEG